MKVSFYSYKGSVLWPYWYNHVMSILIKGFPGKAQFHSECVYSYVIVIEVVTAVFILEVTNNEVMCICIPVQQWGGQKIVQPNYSLIRDRPCRCSAATCEHIKQLLLDYLLPFPAKGLFFLGQKLLNKNQSSQLV